ncbi:MAG: hypothetical protein SFV24_22795 [Gemmatimonadales bacterium]|nr:hypothetical protein [Gemmatimonadota bacterium]MCC7132982.1 hypothetical protein [Gemmatimonadales bacterium]MDX2060658.1 hypothetical protein [Gemmatimonadales bacterium]
MGVELELAVLLGFAILGPAIFAVFEIETPWWRKVLKWSIVCAVTLGLYRVVGHWAVAFPLGAGLAGITFHFWWCRKHGIDPLRATPRDRYYQLRGWVRQ